MKLKEARICLDCDEIYSIKEEHCPNSHCGTSVSNSYPISKWIKAVYPVRPEPYGSILK